MAHLHAFTAIGLGAQVTAFSRGPNGIIKYLALFPQINKEGSVETRESEFSELDAVEEFQNLDEETSTEDFVMRCWIHTHPNFKAFMSRVDILQLYSLQKLDSRMFGIVLSPVKQGVKGLCVHLTREGMDHIDTLYANARASHATNERAFVMSNIDSSRKCYCQIPFSVSYEPCKVADFRSRNEVVGQLRDFIRSGRAERRWIGA